MVGEERVQLQTLSEVLDGFDAAQVLEEIKITIYVDASSDESVPVDALQFQVGVVLLELEVECLVEINVRSFNRVHVVVCRHKLICVEKFRENFH